RSPSPPAPPRSSATSSASGSWACPGSVEALMDFELDEDQEALQDGVRKLCAGAYPMDIVRSLEAHSGVERSLWRRLADAGVFSLRLPEHAGGVGLGSCEAVLVFEELGRALVPGPLLWTHLGAGMVDGAASGDRVVGGVERRG